MENIEKIVPDTSVVIQGILSEKIEKKELKVKEIIIHEALLAELEHQANSGKAIGHLGLDELKRLKELNDVAILYSGKRPRAAEIKYASFGEIDALIRNLAWDEGATLITSDKVQSKVGKVKGLEVIYIKPKIKRRKLKLERYFDKNTMSVHLREDLIAKAKKGSPGKWEFASLGKERLSQKKLRIISKEIIEEAKMREDGFLEIEREGSTIIQLGNYRIVITMPPFSDKWEITAVRPVKKLSLKEYKLSEKLFGRIGEQAEGILIAGAPGNGKCHGKDTPILMYDGSIKMVQDIETGEFVMGPDSKPRTVLGTNKGFGKLYKINPVKGDSYVVNEDHILSLKYIKNNPERTINISVRDFLKSSDHLKFRCKGYRTGVDFPRREVLINPYFLGVWLGDGLSSSLRVASAEPEVVEFLEDYANEQGLVLNQHSYKEGPCQTYAITTGKWGGIVTNPLLNLMRSLDLINNKHIPKIYLINDSETRLRVLAGIIDTDGHISCNCFEISTKFERLKEDILFLARSLGFAAYSKSKIINDKEYYIVRISGDISKIPTKIKRKEGQKRKQIKNVLRTGINVEFIGGGEFYGFELDKDGLYCLKDFTVTHNSTFGSALAEFYASKDKIVKTIEAPRDLQLEDNVTQYSLNYGDAQEIHDILLLTRPDYCVFDEMRNSKDFHLFSDLRMAGIGLAGVIHATNPIDAVQRFIGKIELGVIPHVIDTVIFIKDGQVQKVLSVAMLVKVPSGMTEDDLARPIVEVRDFENDKLEFEIYSYGEETVVIPVTEGKETNPSRELAAKQIENYFKKYGDARVEVVSDHKAKVFVPSQFVARIIGKGGKNIEEVEKMLGISIDVEELKELKSEKKEADFEILDRKNNIIFFIKDEIGKVADIFIDDEFLFSATIGRKRDIKVRKRSEIGRKIIESFDSKKRVNVRV